MQSKRIYFQQDFAANKTIMDQTLTFNCDFHNFAEYRTAMKMKETT